MSFCKDILSFGRDAQFVLHSQIGKWPFFYYRVYAHRYPYRQMRIEPDTQLCIEGFPRSANSYAVVAFKMANPEVKVAHHLHVPAQLIQAVRWNIPAVLCIRHPADAVASFLLFQESQRAATYLKAYRQFHQALLPVMNHLLIVDFTTIIQDMNRVIALVNHHFYRNFHSIPQLAQRQKEIFERLSQWHQRFFGGRKNRGLFPDSERERQKIYLKEKVRNSPWLKPAEEVYSIFHQKAAV